MAAAAAVSVAHIGGQAVIEGSEFNLARVFTQIARAPDCKLTDTELTWALAPEGREAVSPIRSTIPRNEDRP